MRRWNSFATRSDIRSSKLHLTICALEGLSIEEIPNKENYTVRVQIEWRVQRKSYLSRRAVERSLTSKQCLNSAGCVHWNECFEQNCKTRLKDYKSSRSWKINLEVHGLGMESNSIASVLAKLRINTDEIFGLTESTEKIAKFPIKCCMGGSTLPARLIVKLNFFEDQTQEVNGIVHPLSPNQMLPSLSSCVSFKTQPRNKMGSSTSESEEDNKVSEPSYGNLITTNLRIGGLLDETVRLEYGNDENWEEDKPISYQATQKPSLIRLLSWNNRRVRFRVPDHPRDAPLLNKAYGEDGGDDIDNARRFNLSSLQPRGGQVKYDFESSRVLGSDRFKIGKWERRKLRSRDKKLELVTKLFLASIDQRSEKASGEGACTVLATVIADWLHQNPETLPLRCEFDKLIRNGSSEWRNLCKEDKHREKFSDQHFDLDTVLQAGVRPLMVVPEKSYVGFFELENMSNKLELLQGAMSFDSIWEELQHKESTSEGQVYIVSWNDHFFVLKIEEDAIYTIDTLGERLFEGCNKAYILKFSTESEVYSVQPQSRNSKMDSGEECDNRDGRELICKGKSCCKEFIKGFLAALPLRELQENIERGITEEAPLHHLLQIEFQYTTPCNKNSPNKDQILTEHPFEVQKDSIDYGGNIEPQNNISPWEYTNSSN